MGEPVLSGVPTPETVDPPGVSSPADFESQNYVAHLARVTGAVGECVNVPFVLTTSAKGKPVVVNGAAKYEIAAVVLAHLPLVRPRIAEGVDEVERARRLEEARQHRANAEGRIADIIRRSHCKQSDWGGWPNDARGTARRYLPTLPGVARLFEPGATPARCEAWEQAAEGLARSDKYGTWVRRRLWYRFRQLRSDEDGRERVRHLRALVLIRVHRMAVGKAAEWEAKATAERTWLDVCLYAARSQPTQANNEEESGHPGNPTTKTYPFGEVPAGERFHPDDLESGYPAPDEEDRVEAPRLRETVNQCVSRLPGREKEALALLRKGMPHEDIAGRLGLTVDAVRTLLRSAYDRLRVWLNP